MLWIRQTVKKTSEFYPRKASSWRFIYIIYITNFIMKVNSFLAHVEAFFPIGLLEFLTLYEAFLLPFLCSCSVIHLCVTFSLLVLCLLCRNIKYTYVVPNLQEHLIEGEQFFITGMPCMFMAMTILRTSGLGKTIIWQLLR